MVEVFRGNIISCTGLERSKLGHIFHCKSKFLVIERPLFMVLTNSTGLWATEKMKV